MHVFNHMHLSRCYLLLCMLTGDWTGETQYESATLYSELGIRMMCMLRRYKRDDGLDLTATLYLPPGYDKERDGRLPCILWAYPREFKTKVWLFCAPRALAPAGI